MAQLALKPPKDLHAFMIKVDRYQPGGDISGLLRPPWKAVRTFFFLEAEQQEEARGGARSQPLGL
jgi:hypothetical protein